MAYCIWTSIIEYIVARNPTKAYNTAAEAAEAYDAVCNVFGWSMVTQTTLLEPQTQTLKYTNTPTTATSKRSLSVCHLRKDLFQHNCALMEVTKVAPGLPGPALKMSKKFVVDYWKDLSRYLRPVTQADHVGDGQEIVETAENTAITETTDLTQVPGGSEEDAIDLTCNTGERMEFNEILNRWMLVENVDLSDKASAYKEWTFPQCLHEIECMPTTLPMEIAAYASVLKVTWRVKVNAHKFVSGLYYCSVLPDPVLLSRIYTKYKATAIQRKGFFLDVSLAPSGEVTVSNEYRRGFVRTSVTGNDCAGATPAVHHTFTMDAIEECASGTNQDIAAKAMIFLKIEKMEFAAMSMRIPFAQSPIGKVARGVKNFAGVVEEVDAMLDPVTSWFMDKPPMIDGVLLNTPRPRVHFPNGRGMADTTMMSLTPSTVTTWNQRLEKPTVTLEQIARIWGLSASCSWSTSDVPGTELLRLPLDPAFYATAAHTSSGQDLFIVPAPISTIARMCWATVGPIDWRCFAVGTDYHSGSFTVTFEMGRSSAVGKVNACQPYSFQYETHDLGENRKYEWQSPYIYDTHVRRSPNTLIDMQYNSASAGSTKEKFQYNPIANRMIPEAYMVVRVANQLKAANTVKNGVTLFFLSRASKDWRAIFPTNNASRPIAGLTATNSYHLDLSYNRSMRASLGVKYVPPRVVPYNSMDPVEINGVEDLHYTTRHFMPTTKEKAGDRLLKNEEKATEVAQRLAKLTTETPKQLTIEPAKSMTSLEQGELQALRAYAARPRDTGKPLLSPDNSGSEYKVGDQVYKLTQSHWDPVGKKWEYLEVGSPRWEEAKNTGRLTSKVEKVRTQAMGDSTEPTVIRVNQIQVSNNVNTAPPTPILDLLRRPLKILSEVTLAPYFFPAEKIKPNEVEVDKQGDQRDLYHGYCIPLMPPQATHVSPEPWAHASEWAGWDQAILKSGQVGILSLFGAFRGSMNYHFNFYNIVDTNAPIEIVYVPSGGAVAVGDLAATIVPGQSFAENRSDFPPNPVYWRGSPASLGLPVEIVIPSVNPTTSINVPFNSVNVMAPMNREDVMAQAPVRDRSDSNLGHLYVQSRSDCKFDVYWSAGPDFALGEFLGTPPMLNLSLRLLADDDNPIYKEKPKTQAPVFRLNLAKGMSPKPRIQSHNRRKQIMSIQNDLAIVKPQTQAWSTIMGAVTTTVSLVTGMRAMETMAKVGQSSDMVTNLTRRLLVNLDEVDALTKCFKQTMCDGTLTLNDLVKRVDQTVAVVAPQFQGTNLLVTSLMDVWAMYKSPDRHWIANVIIRWLIAGGVLTLTSGIKATGYLLQYITQSSIPTTQAPSADFLYKFFKLFECFKPMAAAPGFAKKLTNLILTSGITKLVWSMRFMDVLHKFIKYVYDIILTVTMWWSKDKCPEAKAFYYLKMHPEYIVAVVKSMQKWSQPENLALLRISPIAKVEYYSTLHVVKILLRVIAAYGANLRLPTLERQMVNFLRKSDEITNTLMTAPVRYEPFVVKIHGETNIGKSYISSHVIMTMLRNIGAVPKGQPTIVRTPGSDFWTNVTGAEYAVLIDEQAHINTESDNRQNVSDLFLLKSPAIFNPPQADLADKDRCLNPFVVVICCNKPFPHMNEVRTPEAYERRVDLLVEAVKKDGIPPNEDYTHLEFKVKKDVRNTSTGYGPPLSATEFKRELLERHTEYHKQEVANVKHRTRELYAMLNRPEEYDQILKDPYSVFYRAMYQEFQNESGLPPAKEMEDMVRAYWQERQCPDILDVPMTQNSDGLFLARYWLWLQGGVCVRDQDRLIVDYARANLISNIPRPYMVNIQRVLVAVSDLIPPLIRPGTYTMSRTDFEFIEQELGGLDVDPTTVTHSELPNNEVTITAERVSPNISTQELIRRYNQGGQQDRELADLLQIRLNRGTNVREHNRTIDSQPTNNIMGLSQEQLQQLVVKMEREGLPLLEAVMLVGIVMTSHQVDTILQDQRIELASCCMCRQVAVMCMKSCTKCDAYYCLECANGLHEKFDCISCGYEQYNSNKDVKLMDVLFGWFVYAVELVGLTITMGATILAMLFEVLVTTVAVIPTTLLFSLLLRHLYGPVAVLAYYLGISLGAAIMILWRTRKGYVIDNVKVACKNIYHHFLGMTAYTWRYLKECFIIPQDIVYTQVGDDCNWRVASLTADGIKYYGETAITKGIVEGTCVHADLYEMSRPDVLYEEVNFGVFSGKLRTTVYYSDKYWWYVANGVTHKVLNKPCKHEFCPLKNVGAVKQLITYAFIQKSDIHFINNMDPRSADIVAVPYQLLQLDKKNEPDISWYQKWQEWLEAVQFWDKLCTVGKWLGSLAVVVSFVAVIIRIFQKLSDTYHQFKDLVDETPEAQVKDYSPDDSGIRRQQRPNRGFRTARPRPQATGDIFGSIVGAVLHNQIVLDVTRSSGQVKHLAILAVKSQLAVMPYHYVKILSSPDTVSIIMRPLLSQISLPYVYDSRDFVQDEGNDLVMFKLPPQMPLKKDIVKHFQTDSYYVNHKIRQSGYISVPPVLENNAPLLQSIVISEMIDNMVSTDSDGEEIPMLNSISYNFSRNGACGSVVYQEVDTKPILGMHVAGIGTGSAGKGYGVIITQEMINELAAQFKIAPIVQAAEWQGLSVEDSRFQAADINIELVGAVEKGCQQPMKTHIVPSMLATYSNIPLTKIPVPLTSKEEPYATQGGSPLHSGVSNNAHSTGDISTTEAQIVGETLITHVANLQPLIVQPQPLDIPTAVVGVPGLPYYDRLDMATSPGYPYNVMKEGSGKDPWITIDDDRKVVQLDPFLERTMNEKMESRRKGEKPNTIFADIMKDERKKIEKLKEKGATRIISMSPLDFTIHCRMFFMHFMAAFMHYRHDLQHAVGINPDGPEWTMLIQNLRQKNFNYHWTLDYKNFGPGFLARAAEWAYEAIIKWTEKHVKMTRVDVTALRVMVHELIQSRHVVDTLVYDQCCGSPSGAALTVIINSLVNLFYIRWAIRRIAMRDTKLAGILRELGLNRFIREKLCLYVYGDDLIAATVPSLQDTINAVTIVEELSQLGVVATSAEKTQQIVPYTTYDKMEFLKRSMKPHPYKKHYYLAPVNQATVKETVMWVHSKIDMREATEEVIGASLLLAYGHGPDFYQEWYFELVNSTSKINLRVPEVTWYDLDNLFFPDVTAQAMAVIDLPIGAWKQALIQTEMDDDGLDNVELPRWQELRREFSGACVNSKKYKSRVF